VVLLLLGSGCTGAADEPGGDRDRPREARTQDGCGPPAFDEVRGRAPRYLPERIDAFPNDPAMCGGAWLPRA
jgi:hypothetical protein